LKRQLGKKSPKGEAEGDLSTAAARQSLPEGEAEEGGCLFV
jgi:hypothetical protein